MQGYEGGLINTTVVPFLPAAAGGVICICWALARADLAATRGRLPRQ